MERHVVNLKDSGLQFHSLKARLLKCTTLATEDIVTKQKNDVSTDFNREVIDTLYQHDKYGTKPKDIVRVFRAYITSFDSDDDGDGMPNIRGIPEWVVCEMHEFLRALRRGSGRPSTWISLSPANSNSALQDRRLSRTTD